MKRLWLFGALLMGLTACGASAAAEEANPGPQVTPSALPDLGLAPELSNEIWLNTAAPLRLADLRGLVVAIDMWTFG